MVKDGELEVHFIKSGDFEQVQVTPSSVGKGDVVDPRIGGAKIIFDSRLDKFQGGQQQQQQQMKTSQASKKQQDYTQEDKKQLLMKMLKKEVSTETKASEEDLKTPEVEVQQQQQVAASGFQRQTKNAAFKKESEAEPLYTPRADERLTKKEALLLEVAEKYNLIMNFLKGYNSETRELFSFVITKVIEDAETSLEDISDFLAFLEINGVEIFDSKQITQNSNKEKLLQLKLAKKSIDWLLDNPPTTSFGKLKSLD